MLKILIISHLIEYSINRIVAPIPTKMPISVFNSLPNVKYSDYTKLKAFTEKFNVAKTVVSLLNREKLAFSPFPIMFSKGYLLRLVKFQDCSRHYLLIREQNLRLVQIESNSKQHLLLK